MTWPTTADDLRREQERLATEPFETWTPPPWTSPRPLRVGACAVVFGRAGRDGVGFAAAVSDERQQVIDVATHVAPVDAPFEPGQLALREGPILERVVRRLALRPDVLLVAAAGRDHPRRAGLALHLGAVLDLPTVGVTDDPLLATGEDPAREWASAAALRIGDEIVAYRLRSRGGVKPIVAHAAWRTTAETAKEIALGATTLARWPEPLREARRMARELRARRTLS
ncbi:MAG TPA: endonuclease V [Anaeromyxobacteraceae bacterium]|nr:endonuclease V [Anaeromyxobacteraceae bacterium]